MTARERVEARQKAAREQASKPALIWKGNKYRSFEQLYNNATKGRTMTAKQSEWFLLDNSAPIQPTHKQRKQGSDFGYSGNTPL